MRKVLVAFDGSDSSKRALQSVIDFARDHAATLEVHLLNVQHEPVLYGEYVTSTIIDQLQQSLMASADHALEWPRDHLKAPGISF